MYSFKKFKNLKHFNVKCNLFYKPALFCPLSIAQTSRNRTHSLLTSVIMSMLFKFSEYVFTGYNQVW